MRCFSLLPRCVGMVPIARRYASTEATVFDYDRHGALGSLPQPTEVQALKTHLITAVAAGDAFTAALGTANREAGVKEVFVWGDSHSADSTRERLLPRPLTWAQPLTKDEELVQLACGQTHGLVLTSAGRVFAWGTGAEGQLGLGDQTYAPTLTLVAALNGVNVKRVACGWSHSFAVTQDGKLYAWGSSHFNQLGLGEFNNQPLPQHVLALSSVKVTDAAGGIFHSLALTADKEVYGFGRNKENQLAETDHRMGVSRLSKLWHEPVHSVHCGLFHSVLLTTSSRLLTFGSGAEGQLGMGPHLKGNQARMKPVRLPPARAAACAPLHNMALVQEPGKSSFSVWSWGKGTDYQLGNMQRQSSGTPWPIALTWGPEWDVWGMTGGWAHSALLLAVPRRLAGSAAAPVSGAEVLAQMQQQQTAAASSSSSSSSFSLNSSSATSPPASSPFPTEPSASASTGSQAIKTPPLPSSPQAGGSRSSSSS